MAEPLLTLRGGPFTLNTAKAPYDLGDFEASTLVNVDLFASQLKGMWGTGVTGATLAAGTYQSIYYAEGASPSPWRSSSQIEHFCYDTVNVSNGNHMLYLTDNQHALGTRGKPQIWDGATFYMLGVNAPDASTVLGITNGSSGGPRAYKVTAVSIHNGITIESNPYSVGAGAANCNGAVIGLAQTIDDPDNAKINYKNIYATAPGTTDPPYSYVGQVADNATSWTDDGSASPTGAVVLDWDTGGNASSESTPYDNSPAPSLGLLADSLFGGTADSGSPGMGILFGALDGYWLTWSRMNYPWYWATTHYMRMPETIEAITADQQIAYVFCHTGIYGITGPDDEHLSIERTRAAVGILPGCGKTLARVPGGFVFLSRQGLVFFDGFNTVSLTDGVIDPSYAYFYNLQWAGAYSDGLYFLYELGGAVDMYVFRLEGARLLRVTSCDLNPSLLMVNPYASPPGMYALVGSDIKFWSPRQFSSEQGALDWSYTGPKSFCGDAEGQKRASRCRFTADNAVTVTVDVGGTGMTTVGHSTTVKRDWLPPGFIGDWIQVSASGTGGGAALYSLTIDGTIARVR